MSKNTTIQWCDNTINPIMGCDGRGLWPTRGQASTSRVKTLLEIPSYGKGLSVEPLVEPVEHNLEGIDWVIIGSASGKHARGFGIQWVRAPRKCCQEKGGALFVKQLEAKPVEGGFPLLLEGRHGGDWNEWPSGLLVHEMPEASRDWHSAGPETERALKCVLVSNVNNRDY